MRLQSCATVQYALPKHKSRLLYEDLQDRLSLQHLHPQRPAAWTDLQSGQGFVMAALRPSPPMHLYFVAKGDGTHIFSRTFAEHQGAIAGLGR